MEKDDKDVRKRIDEDYDDYCKNARKWSWVYHGFQFGGAILSAMAALVLKTESIGSVQSRNDFGALIAALSALVITILITGRFKDKWEANLLATFAVHDLKCEIEKEGKDQNKILKKLQDINLTYKYKIFGLPPTERGKKAENGKESSTEK
jgi:hypothetical protein